MPLSRCVLCACVPLASCVSHSRVSGSHPLNCSPTPPNKRAYIHAGARNTLYSVPSLPSSPPHRHPHAVPSDTSPRGCQLRRKEEKHPHVCDPPCPCPMRNAPPRLHFGILSVVCPTNRTLFCSSLQPMLSIPVSLAVYPLFILPSPSPMPPLPCFLAYPAVPSPMSVSTSVCPSGALPAAHHVPQHP